MVFTHRVRPSIGMAPSKSFIQLFTTLPGGRDVAQRDVYRERPRADKVTVRARG